MPRKKIMNNAIQTEDDFGKIFAAICLDLGQALDRYTLFQNLMTAKQGPFTKAVSQSQTFWSLVYGSLQEATLFRLCRAYDQHDGALTLRTLLETIRLRPTFLPVPTDPIDTAKLQRDLDSVSHETSRPVKHLMMWRHKLFAHRDAEKIVSNRTLADDYPITYDEVGALLDNGFDILNRYSVKFFRTSNLPKMVGADDYLKVLQTLQDDVEQDEARITDLARRAGELSL
jgi:hypothetical protein